MKTDELYKIVKDVPQEAWPQLRNGVPTYDEPHKTWWYNGRVEFPDALEFMFIGSMVKHQIKKDGRIPTLGTSGAYFIWSSKLGSYRYFDTLIEALAAACIEIGENKQ